MAMRGSWGRKKRSGGRIQMAPFHESFDTDGGYGNVRGVIENVLRSDQHATIDNLSKKDIPKINEEDIAKFAEYFSKYY